MPNRAVIKDRGIGGLPGFASSNLAVELKSSKVYRGIPAPVLELESIYNTTAALKEMVEILTRQRGLVDDSAVTVSELNLVYEELLRRIQDINDLALESFVGHGGLPPLGTAAGDFTNYTDIHDNAGSKLLFNSTTGIATIGIAGAYTVNGLLQILDGQKDESYEIAIVTTGSNPGTEVVAAAFWNNKQEIAVPSYSVPISFARGDTVKQALVITPGGDAQQFGLSSFSVELIN